MVNRAVIILTFARNTRTDISTEQANFNITTTPLKNLGNLGNLDLTFALRNVNIGNTP